MTWIELLNRKLVTTEPVSKGELDNLRSIVSRSLANVSVAGLTSDIRFILAYDAARTLSLMIVHPRAIDPDPSAGTITLSWACKPPILPSRPSPPTSTTAECCVTSANTISPAEFRIPMLINFCRKSEISARTPRHGSATVIRI